MSAIASVARLTATLAVFSLHNRRARSSAWLAPNSSPISQTARPFAESLVSSSRHIIVARVSVKSLLPARPTSHANVIAQGLRSPVQNIVLTRTGSTSGSGSPEPRSDSSMPYEHAYYCAPRNKSRLKQSLSSRCTAGFRAAYDRCGSIALKKGSRSSANNDSVCLRLSVAEACHDGSADGRSEPFVLPVQP